MMQSGHISLPNGLGLDFTDEDGGHRHVPARLEAIA
jgi:hypothetical protein